mmetsp:Transcript_84059/g.271743  ORF Transcript_84059/g.271743 Transcript_84059/m.271743 type:complete len:236 (+) Transcript_84059:1610-2317(+)
MAGFPRRLFAGGSGLYFVRVREEHRALPYGGHLRGDSCQHEVYALHQTARVVVHPCRLVWTARPLLLAARRPGRRARRVCGQPLRPPRQPAAQAALGAAAEGPVLHRRRPPLRVARAALFCGSAPGRRRQHDVVHEQEEPGGDRAAGEELQHGHPYPAAAAAKLLQDCVLEGGFGRLLHRRRQLLEQPADGARRWRLCVLQRRPPPAPRDLDPDRDGIPPHGPGGCARQQPSVPA